MDYKYKKLLRGATFGGAAAGGVLGGIVGHAESKNYNRGKSESKKINPLKATAIGALGGAALGGGYGHLNARRLIRADKSYRKSQEDATRRHYERMHRESGGKGDWNYQHYSKIHDSTPKEHFLKALGLTGKEKTKDEVKRKFREAAMRNHPDRGGDARRMQEINNAYKELQRTDWHEKLGFAAGFSKILKR